jgi:hypothetical protein
VRKHRVVGFSQYEERVNEHSSDIRSLDLRNNGFEDDDYSEVDGDSDAEGADYGSNFDNASDEEADGMSSENDGHVRYKMNTETLLCSESYQSLRPEVIVLHGLVFIIHESCVQENDKVHSGRGRGYPDQQRRRDELEGICASE